MKKVIMWIFIILLIILTIYLVLGILNESNKLETNEYKINDNFQDINIITDVSNIEFVSSSNNLVLLNENKNANHVVKVHNNTLVIEIDDNRKWYEYIGINLETPKITIYLPIDEYGMLSINSSVGDVNIPSDFKFKNMNILSSVGDITNYATVLENIKINTSTGDIYTKNITANNLDFSTSTGKIDIVDVNCLEDINLKVSTGKTNIVNTNCKNLFSKGDTGNINLENVIALEKFLIERSTGDIKFKYSDASDIYVKTDTGDVTGNFLTDKVVFATSSTGNIDIPKIITDEKCEIITDTGDIKITITKKGE